MSQIIDPVPQGEGDNSLLCSYINATNQIQIARIANVPNWYFERVVFPGQRLVFEAISYGVLEIHSGMMASSILSDRIPCKRLTIQEDIKSDRPPLDKPQSIKSSSVISNSHKSVPAKKIPQSLKFKMEIIF